MPIIDDNRNPRGSGTLEFVRNHFVPLFRTWPGLTLVRLYLPSGNRTAAHSELIDIDLDDEFREFVWFCDDVNEAELPIWDRNVFRLHQQFIQLWRTLPKGAFSPSRFGDVVLRRQPSNCMFIGPDAEFDGQLFQVAEAL